MSKNRDKKEEIDEAEKAAKNRHNCKIAAIILISIAAFLFVLTIILALSLDIEKTGIYNFLTFLSAMFSLSFISSIILALCAVDWEGWRKEREMEQKEEEERKAAKNRSKYQSTPKPSKEEDEFWGSERETPEDEMFRLSMWDMLDEDDDNDD